LEVRLGNVDFKTLELEDSNALTTKIAEEQTRDVLWQCEGFKSLGYGNFNFNFVKKSWEIVKGV